MNKEKQPKSKISNTAFGHWVDISKIWKQVGPPLRPSEQDINFFTQAINLWKQKNRSPHALILGVTPELYHLSWQKGTDLLAADHTQCMIDAVWPGSKNEVICSDWTMLPLEPGSRDIILCDGGLHLLTYPEGQQKLVRTIYRLLTPGGLCIFRLFIPPKQFESSEKVIDELRMGKISNLNLLKLRLGMALQKNSEYGIELNRVWSAVSQVEPDFEQLALKVNWPLEHLLAINTYKNSSNRYYFLSFDKVRHLFCENPGEFEIEKVNIPTYELGERCPTVVFRRR